MPIILFPQGVTPPPPPPPSTTFPSVLLEMSLDDALNAPRLDDADAVLNGIALDATPAVFTEDISQYFRSGSTARGGSRELQRVEAGTASFVVDNRDGVFTPFNVSSPFYPYLLPMRRIRLLADIGGGTYPVFYGYVEAWPITFPEDVDTVVTIQLVDGFKLLSLALVSGDYPEQSSGARVAAMLDFVAWPISQRVVDVGAATVPAITLENISVLEHIQQVEHAEGGKFFIDRAGRAVFKDRAPDNTPDLSERTWADDGTGMSYRDLSLEFSDSLILNDVHMSREGGEEQVAADTLSQAQHGIRSSNETSIQLSTDAQVLDRATLLVERYAQPDLRIEQLVDNAMQHGLWDRVFSRDLGDPVVVIESRTGVSQTSTVEGISHDISSDLSWTVTFNVAPTQIVHVAILNDPTALLDDPTALLGR